ncbi:MAG: RluA family pseudouridine synthase [Treponemataceae bacterium]|nr:RluA family pseudouridine synthase [Treponemataceae bacterium]
MNLQILFQDEDIIIVNKPSGLLSVPYPGCRGKTALDLIENIMRKSGKWSKFHRPFAVHRLDRDTSGVMVFALNERCQKKMMDKWQSIVSERSYIALAENPQDKRRELQESGTIDKPIFLNSKNHGGYVSKNKQDTNKSLSAITHYKILKRGKKYTLFQLDLETGRKNQIRAHLSSAGYPLAGDKNYGAKTDPFGRLALHARTLEFIHPTSNEKMKFEVEEPVEWEKLIR